MLILALTCAVITAVLIAIVSLWHRHARPIDSLAHARTLYAGFVADVDRREARGDVDADLANEERVEAARALLKAEETQSQPAAFKPAYAAIGTAAIAALSFGLYMFVIGHPLLSDQPYKARLAQWTRDAQQDPASIPPEAFVAVWRQGAKARVNDPVYWLFLARIELATGHYYDAAKAFEHCQSLVPENFSAWSEMGEALVLVAGGTVPADAQRAFEKALTIDADDPRAHYYLGKLALDNGDYPVARAHYERALNQLAADDSRREVIADQLRAVDMARTNADGPRAMVAQLEAKLKADPENPDGWARLLRSYAVLGNAPARAKALAAMRAHYRDRPELADSIAARSQGAVGAENTGGQ